MLKSRLTCLSMALIMSMCAIPVPAVTRQPTQLELKEHKVLICMSDDGYTCIETYTSPPMSVAKYVGRSGFKFFYKVEARPVADQPFKFNLYIEVGN